MCLAQKCAVEGLSELTLRELWVVGSVLPGGTLPASLSPNGSSLQLNRRGVGDGLGRRMQSSLRVFPLRHGRGLSQGSRDV